MNKLIECVPNFSEGRDLDKVNGIVDIMSNVDQVTILDVDLLQIQIGQLLQW